MPITVFDVKGIPGDRREGIETAVVAGGAHTAVPYEAWIASAHFRGGFRVLITGPHGFERTACSPRATSLRPSRTGFGRRLSRNSCARTDGGFDRGDVFIGATSAKREPMRRTQVERKKTRRKAHRGKKVERSGANRQAVRVTGPDIPGMDRSNLPADQFPRAASFRC